MGKGRKNERRVEMGANGERGKGIEGEGRRLEGRGGDGTRVVVFSISLFLYHISSFVALSSSIISPLSFSLSTSHLVNYSTLSFTSQTTINDV